MFVQYEVWGALDGHDSLVECTSTLKAAEILVMDQLENYGEMWILEDIDGEDLKEVARFKGL
jgi:hypothetical protein